MAFGIWLLLFCAFDLVSSQLMNVALGRHVNQSANYNDDDGIDWTADKAIDNNTCRAGDPDYADPRCCSATLVTAGVNAFWRINLEVQFEVEKLEIFARIDLGDTDNQLVGFQLNIIGEEGDEVVDVIDSIPGIDDTYQKVFDPTKPIQEIKVTRPGENVLTICEFKVFVACNDSTYGDNCQNKCGQCVGSEPCNKTTGHCPSGECEPGWWGDGCFYQCGNCSSSAPCNSTTGFCVAGCRPGWKGSLCNTTCNDGEWGPDCSNNCTNCFNGAVCDIIDGYCPSGCDAGWTQPKCDTECVNSYGLNCSESCGNCADGIDCNHINGSCFGNCSPGWQGELCIEECENGTWGVNCSSSCGNCIDNTTCNHMTGECSSAGCMAGWEGDRCLDMCLDGWGTNCREPCGACLGGANCHHINGTCYGNCDPGWLGELCIEACVNGTWGVQCNNSCGNCQEDTACHNEHGECPEGCREGWTGKRCKEEKTDDTTSSSTGLIGGIVGGVFAAIVVVLALLVWRRHRGRAKDTNETSFENYINPAMSEETRTIDNQSQPTSHQSQPSSQNKSLYKNAKKNGSPTAIAVTDLREFCRNNCVKNGILFGEFETFPYGLQYETQAANSAANKKKNRYKDMFAYDKNRVTLPTCGGQHTSDYVNASFIKGYTADVVYIASQGVMESTLDDFWWMIWTQNVTNIVMLTQCHEAGRLKSFQYWPGEDIGNYGDLTVSKEEIFADFTIRHMICTYNTTSAQRSITQFHYTAWPDKDIPNHPLSLVQFWRKVKDSPEANRIPWLVHCSAGVGRTGTFIALDYLYQQAKVEGFVDLNGCIRMLRELRVNMVQTATQYVFLHQAVLEAVQPIGSICKPDRLPGLLSQLKRPSSGSLTKLETEFQSIQQDTEDAMSDGLLQATIANDIYQNVSMEKFADSNFPENLNKSRDQNVLPDDLYRPRLKDMIGCQGDYINAIWLSVQVGKDQEKAQSEKDSHSKNRGGKNKQTNNQTYLRTDGMIITQSPLPDTVVDFLRLVWDNHVTMIVMVDDGKNLDNVGTYWESRRAGPFVVEVKLCQTSENITVREIFVSLLGESRTLKQFQYKDWPEDKEVPNSGGSFLELHEMVYASCDVSSLVVVHCLNGANKSGLFCVLWTIMERLKAEKNIAIAETVRSMKIRRPQIIPNVEQYRFCYDMVLEHVQSFELYATVL